MFKARINLTNPQITSLAMHLFIQLSSTQPQEVPGVCQALKLQRLRRYDPTTLGHSKFNTLVKSPCFRVRGLGSLTCKMELSAIADIPGAFTTSYWLTSHFNCDCVGYFHTISVSCCTVNFPPQVCISSLSAFSQSFLQCCHNLFYLCRWSQPRRAKALPRQLLINKVWQLVCKSCSLPLSQEAELPRAVT